MEKVETSVEEELRQIAESNISESAKNERLMRMAERLTANNDKDKYISAPGKCPHALVKEYPLLEQRRVEYAIPDAAFAQEAVYDRIFMFQLPRTFGSKINGTSLIRPDSAVQRDEESTPRGIIITAGLKALDNLRAHGMDIGHIVNFIRLAPFRLPYLQYQGVDMCLVVLRDGDIIASEELPKLRNAARARTSLGQDGNHRVETKGADGEWRSFAASIPVIDGDY